MGLIEKFIPDNVKSALNKIFPDQELRRDLSIALTEAAPLFVKAANKVPATPEQKNLKDTFNDVAIVLPLIQRFLEKGKLPGTFEAVSLAPKYGPVFSRMYNNPQIDETFRNPGPELNAVYEELLEKSNVQEALKRVLLKPVGQEVLTLQQENGKFYAVESLSGAGIKFPVREEIYNSVKNVAGNKNQPPKGPAGPGV